MEQPYLKQCPFCGETKDLAVVEGALVHDDDSRDDFCPQKWVECQNCGALGPPTDRREDAVESWNERKNGKEGA